MCERIRVGNFFGGGLSTFLSLVGFPLRDEFRLQVLLDGRRRRKTFDLQSCWMYGIRRNPKNNRVHFCLFFSTLKNSILFLFSCQKGQHAKPMTTTGLLQQQQQD
jgi:hypothetical protein